MPLNTCYNVIIIHSYCYIIITSWNPQMSLYMQQNRLFLNAMYVYMYLCIFICTTIKYQLRFMFDTCWQEEVRNAERAIQLMGASVLQLCSGMFVIFSSPTIYNLSGKKNENIQWLIGDLKWNWDLYIKVLLLPARLISYSYVL